MHWRSGVVKRISENAAMLSTVCLCCLGAGCVSSADITSSPNMSNTRLTGYRAVVIETVSEAPNSEQQRKLLHALIVSGLHQRSRLKPVVSVPPEDSGPRFKLMARIRDLYKVSDGTRVAFPVLAGQANITVDVELTDLQRGTQIGDFQVVGKSGVLTGAANTEEAVQRAAEQIVAEIVKRQ
jgi:hypothetical protein